MAVVRLELEDGSGVLLLEDGGALLLEESGEPELEPGSGFAFEITPAHARAFLRSARSRDEAELLALIIALDEDDDTW